MEDKTITLTYPWDENGYCPRVEFVPTLTKEGFHMHITAWEKEPKRVMEHHFDPVHLDSCVEWFVNFAPELTDSYFNFEINANGRVNVAFRRDRANAVCLTEEDANALGIVTEILDDRWIVDYTVPFALIVKYIPGFVERDEYEVLTNFYKCGDETEYPHYGLWNPIPLPAPDFHRPEFFQKLMIR